MDAWAVWNWTGGRVHRTDPTIAARTMLFDLDRGDWSDDLLRLFGAPRALLPEVRPVAEDPVAIAPGATLRAVLADQASGLLAVTGDRPDTAMVNFGTGTFVLRPTENRALRPAGFLAGPALVRRGSPTVWALEGPVNGGAAAVDAHGRGPTALPPRDPAPDAFCLPDTAGVGAPHWRGDVPFTLSDACDGLPPAELRRVTLEGLVFRVREVLDGLFPDRAPAEVRLAGGLSHEPFLPAALAAVLGREVTVHDEREATLLGVARLAAGTEAGRSPHETVAPSAAAHWLPAKSNRWMAWRDTVLE
jgi:glycerol kinase